MQEAPKADFLHRASHSSLNDENLNRSYIQFADGNLYLHELYGLVMPSASLVVLSSCQGALGGENPGRDLSSLASAFSIAGAPAVVASLWRVEDTATASLIENFSSTVMTLPLINARSAIHGLGADILIP